MAGWIGFAGILMLIIGMIDFFQGLIGLFKDDYYVVTASGFLAVNLTTWSWVLLIWGVLLVLAGLGLLGGQGWARWFTIVVVALELLRSARLPRQQQLPALGADGPDAQRDRALRADGTLERERGRHRNSPIAGSRRTQMPLRHPGSRPSLGRTDGCRVTCYLALVVEFSDRDLKCECPDDLARRRCDASCADDGGNCREDSLDSLGVDLKVTHDLQVQSVGHRRRVHRN